MGWTPDVVLGTPIPQLVLAIDGRYQYARNTNPFGSGKSSVKPADNETIKKRRAALDAINAQAKIVRDKKCQNPQKDS